MLYCGALLVAQTYVGTGMSTQWNSIKPSDILTSEEQHRLRQRSDLMGWWMLLHAWGVIAAAMALFVVFPNVLTFIVSAALIGSRQLGLSILMHEASHGMMFRTRWMNEKLGQWLAAAPLFINMKSYRIRHMAHHRFTRTDKDPENYLYTPFPVSKSSMGRKILRDFTGIVFLRTQIGLFRFLWGEKDGRWARLYEFYRTIVVFLRRVHHGIRSFRQARPVSVDVDDPDDDHAAIFPAHPQHCGACNRAGPGRSA